MTEAERIAAGLSDLDKRILLHGLPHQRRKILAGLPNKLVSAATGRITKLGLAVRKVLERSNDTDSQRSADNG